MLVYIIFILMILPILSLLINFKKKSVCINSFILVSLVIINMLTIIYFDDLIEIGDFGTLEDVSGTLVKYILGYTTFCLIVITVQNFMKKDVFSHKN